MIDRAGAFRALAALLFAAALPAAARAQLPKPGLPLIADRSATFTTSKGTWISLDVSPDAQTIVLIMPQFQLGVYDRETGTRTTMSARYGSAFRPRTSGNSNSVRYVMKNGRIYEGGTLNEIWPRQRVLAGQYWQAGAPRTAAGIR